MTTDRNSSPAEAEMVLVPREPTREMLAAAQSAWLDDPMRRTTTLYRAMLTAAPKATEAPGLREALTAIRDLARRNLRGSDEPHAIIIDGKRHEGPVADAWVNFLKLTIETFDAALSATPQPVAVPDDGAGRDVIARQLRLHANSHGLFLGDKLRELMREAASALSAERAAHEQTRQAYRIEADKLADEMELNLRLEAEVARLRKALEEAKEKAKEDERDRFHAFAKLRFTGATLAYVLGFIEDYGGMCPSARAAARSSREEGK